MTSELQTRSSFVALALQTSTQCVSLCKNRDEAREIMSRNIAGVARSLKASIAFIQSFSGQAVRLVVLPEYFVTGFPVLGSIDSWAGMAALEIDGPEYEALARIAQDSDLFLAGNAYELDPNFPGLYFQTCFIIAPSGETVLRYRRLISLNSPSPYDVWDRYLDIYGADAIFPVARTEIGNLAAIASEEILYPEIARCHAMRGAEVFVHPTSEVGSPALTPKDVAKRARAIENLAYVVSTNNGTLEGTGIPEISTTGMSKIIDYQGKVLAEAATGGQSMSANARIDLAAMREVRRHTGLTNTLVRQPFQAYAESYAGTNFQAPNRMLKNGELNAPDSKQAFQDWQRADIERLSKAGII